MRDLPRLAQIYIICLSVLALTAFLPAGLIVISQPELILPAVVLALLVAFFDLHPVSGFKNVETTISTAVKISGVLLFDPSIVLVSVFLGTALAESRLKRPHYKKIFNVSLMTTTYTILTLVYTIAQGGSMGIVETPRNLFALAALAVSDLTVNSLIVSLVIALATRSSVRYIWSENFKPVALHDLSMVPLGALIAMLWRFSPWAVLFAGIPLYLVLHSTKLINDLRRQTLDALMMLARMLDERDEDTHQHCEMVATHAEEMARGLGLSQGEIDIVKRAAYLHDIGKIGMSNAILYKPGALTQHERELAKKHAVYGAELLEQFPVFKRGALYVRHHHERWDGKGYPDGLKGEAIPLGARILSVADSFQAMIEDRPYRKALPLSTALQEIYCNSGTQFDPQVVRALFQAKGHACPVDDKAPSDPRIPKLRKLHPEADKVTDPQLAKAQMA